MTQLNGRRNSGSCQKTLPPGKFPSKQEGQKKSHGKQQNHIQNILFQKGMTLLRKHLLPGPEKFQLILRTALGIPGKYSGTEDNGQKTKQKQSRNRLGQTDQPPAQKPYGQDQCCQKDQGNADRLPYGPGSVVGNQDLIYIREASSPFCRSDTLCRKIQGTRLPGNPPSDRRESFYDCIIPLVNLKNSRRSFRYTEILWRNREWCIFLLKQVWLKCINQFIYFGSRC